MQLSVPWRFGNKKPFSSIPRINWAHPIARGLVFYGYDTGSGLIVDLVDGLFPTFLGTTHPPNLGSRYGTGLKFASGQQNPAFNGAPRVPSILPSGRYSLACAWFITALPSVAFTLPFGMANGGASDNAFLWNSGATNDMQWSVANLNPTPFTGNSINVFHSLLGTNVTTSSQSVYFDGKLAATTALAASVTDATCGISFNGSNLANTQNGVTGWVYYGAVWNRTVSSQEAWLLHNDPYCFLIYPEDEIFASLAKTPSAAIAAILGGAQQSYLFAPQLGPVSILSPGILRPNLAFPAIVTQAQVVTVPSGSTLPMMGVG